MGPCRGNRIRWIAVGYRWETQKPLPRQGLLVCTERRNADLYNRRRTAPRVLKMSLVTEPETQMSKPLTLRYVDALINGHTSHGCTGDGSVTHMREITEITPARHALQFLFREDFPSFLKILRRDRLLEVLRGNREARLRRKSDDIVDRGYGRQFLLKRGVLVGRFEEPSGIGLGHGQMWLGWLIVIERSAKLLCGVGGSWRR